MWLTKVLQWRSSHFNGFSVREEMYVPKHSPVPNDGFKRLQDFLISKPNIVVLTGAGISTEAGIPDYRSEGVGLYARSNHKPIQHMDFVKSAYIRQRYWARNFVAWPRFSATEPCATHKALASLERKGRLQSIVTQNVDGLHTKAGSKNIIELHGSGYTVICLSCDYRIDRQSFQHILASKNPEFTNAPDMVRPDGDVELPEQYIDNFCVPKCPKCSEGNLKPEIVFFGDNVPRTRIQHVAEMLCASDGLLVLGSSLVVFSGYRLVMQAKDLNLPVAIVNIGATRADELADIKLSAKCGDVIPKLFDFRK